jgi:hypothetical protein
MLQLMIIELLAREFAHAELVLVLSRRNAVLADCIAVRQRRTRLHGGGQVWRLCRATRTN